MAHHSKTETYAALRLEVDNWRWNGVPFYIRAGKAMAETVTEVRVVFRHAPKLAFAGSRWRHPDPNNLVLRVGPQPGASIWLQSKKPMASGLHQVHLDMDFADEGGEGPTPYEQLLYGAMHGDRSHFIREDAVEETWRIMQPLIEEPPPVEPYARGSWGPRSGAEDARPPWWLERAVAARRRAEPRWQSPRASAKRSRSSCPAPTIAS